MGCACGREADADGDGAGGARGGDGRTPGQQYESPGDLDLNGDRDSRRDMEDLPRSGLYDVDPLLKIDSNSHLLSNHSSTSPRLISPGSAAGRLGPAASTTPTAGHHGHPHHMTGRGGGPGGVVTSGVWESADTGCSSGATSPTSTAFDVTGMPAPQPLRKEAELERLQSLFDALAASETTKPLKKAQKLRRRVREWFEVVLQPPPRGTPHAPGLAAGTSSGPSTGLSDPPLSAGIASQQHQQHAPAAAGMPHGVLETSSALSSRHSSPKLREMDLMGGWIDPGASPDPSLLGEGDELDDFPLGASAQDFYDALFKGGTPPPSLLSRNASMSQRSPRRVWSMSSTGNPSTTHLPGRITIPTADSEDEEESSATGRPTTPRPSPGHSPSHQFSPGGVRPTSPRQAQLHQQGSHPSSFKAVHTRTPARARATSVHTQQSTSEDGAAGRGNRRGSDPLSMSQPATGHHSVSADSSTFAPVEEPQPCVTISIHADNHSSSSGGTPVGDPSPRTANGGVATAPQPAISCPSPYSPKSGSIVSTAAPGSAHCSPNASVNSGQNLPIVALSPTGLGHAHSPNAAPNAAGTASGNAAATGSGSGSGSGSGLAPPVLSRRPSRSQMYADVPVSDDIMDYFDASAPMPEPPGSLAASMSSQQGNSLTGSQYQVGAASPPQQPPQVTSPALGHQQQPQQQQYQQLPAPQLLVPGAQGGNHLGESAQQRAARAGPTAVGTAAVLRPRADRRPSWNPMEQQRRPSYNPPAARPDEIGGIQHLGDSTEDPPPVWSMMHGLDDSEM